MQVRKCTGRQQSRKRVYVSDDDYEPDEDEMKGIVAELHVSFNIATKKSIKRTVAKRFKLNDDSNIDD